MSISSDLERARSMAFADDQIAAKDLLLSLLPAVEQADRDDLALEVFAQLGAIYLVRSANDGVRECIRRIDDCLGIYIAIVAGTMPDAAAQVRMSDEEVRAMICRYTVHSQFLRTTLAATTGDHDAAEQALAVLAGEPDGEFPELADEHGYLLTYAQTICATALCDDDLHTRSVPLWHRVLATLEGQELPPDAGTHQPAAERMDHLRIQAGTAYGRFCVDTGRVAEAQPWLRRAGARAAARGWDLATARTQLELAAASWSSGDQPATERLVTQAYPVIAQHARADDVSRCWLYFGLTRLAAGGLEAADECFSHAERHWRELGRPIPVHRILLQRSWIEIFRGRFAEAVELVAQARECLDSSPRTNWLHYARLDNHLGTVWRADALGDLGFDGAGDPADGWREAETKYAGSLGVITAEPGSPGHRSAQPKLEQAADLKLPAALAVDSVRYSIDDAEARLRWAVGVSAPVLAGAFAVAWEWDNTDLISQLIEYHSARGSFSTEPGSDEIREWAATATATIPLDDVSLSEDDMAYAAGGSGADGKTGTAEALTRIGPLPPLRMQPAGDLILERYRALARARYGREVTADEPAWSTAP